MLRAALFLLCCCMVFPFSPFLGAMKVHDLSFDFKTHEKRELEAALGVGLGSFITTNEHEIVEKTLRLIRQENNLEKREYHKFIYESLFEVLRFFARHPSLFSKFCQKYHLLINDHPEYKEIKGKMNVISHFLKELIYLDKNLISLIRFTGEEDPKTFFLNQENSCESSFKEVPPEIQIFLSLFSKEKLDKIIRPIKLNDLY
jgi:hypothetical protein